MTTTNDPLADLERWRKSGFALRWEIAASPAGYECYLQWPSDTNLFSLFAVRKYEPLLADAIRAALAEFERQQGGVT